jgi:hypothetical protein
MASLDMTNSLFSTRIIEKINVGYTSFSSNVLTYDYINSRGLLYYALASNTNFQLALTNVPIIPYRSFTFSLLILVSNYKAYANTCKINGVLYPLKASGGLANVDLTKLTSTGMLLQQFTIIYTNNSYPTHVITNVSQFY